MKPKPPLLLTSQTYVWLTIRQLWDNLPQLIWGGFLFTVLLLPTITLTMLNLPWLALAAGCLTVLPAWGGLLHQQSLLVQDMRPKWHTVLDTFVRYWGRTTRFTILLVIPICILQLTLPAVLTQADPPPIVLIGLFANLLLTFLLLATFIYSLPILVQYDLTFSTALRNGFVLSGRYATHTLGLIALATLFLFAILFLSQALFLILPFIWTLFVTNNCRLVISLEEEEEK